MGTSLDAFSHLLEKEFHSSDGLDEFEHFLDKPHDPHGLQQYEHYLDKPHNPYGLHEFQKYLDPDFVPLGEFEQYLEKKVFQKGVQQGLEHLGLGLFLRNPYLQFGLDIGTLALQEFGPDWMQTGFSIGPWNFTFEVAHSRSGVPKTAGFSCFNASVPDDVGWGTAWCPGGDCPGGACDGTYINAPCNQFAPDQTYFKFEIMHHTGGGWYVPRSLMYGPMAPFDYPRFGLKGKICGPGLFQSWDTRPAYYGEGTREIKRTVLPLPEAITPPDPVVQISEPGRDPRRQLARRPKRKRYQRPSVTVVVDERTRPDELVEPRLDNHDILPPVDKYTREKKTDRAKPVNKLTAMRIVAKLYDAATEAKDIVDALYDALPKGSKCPGAKSMDDKAYCVWSHIDDLNVDKAIWNLVKNEIGDRLVGRFIGKVGRHTPYGTIGQGMKAPSPPRWAFMR